MAVLRYELNGLFWQIEYPFNGSKRRFQTTNGNVGENGLSEVRTFPTVNEAMRAQSSAKTSVSRRGYALVGGDVPLVECPVCRVKARLLTPGHVRKHGLSWVELVELYPDVDTVPADVREARAVVGRRVVRDNQHLLQTPENIKKRTDAMHASLRKSGYSKQRERFIAMNKDASRKPLIAKWNRERVWTDEARRKIATKCADRNEKMRRAMSRPHLDLMAHMKNSAWFRSLNPELRVGNMSIDIAVTEFKVAVEMQGCFWHGCSWCFQEPSLFQKKRISADIARRKSLEDRGWTVLLVPECAFKRSPAKVLAAIEYHTARVCELMMERGDEAAPRDVLPRIDPSKFVQVLSRSTA